MMLNTKNYFYDLPDDIQHKILLFVSEALVIQLRNLRVIELHKEFMNIRNDLWSYSGRLAFVAARESDAQEQAEWDYDPNNTYYDGPCGGIPDSRSAKGWSYPVYN